MSNFHGLDSITLNPGDDLPPLAPGTIRLYNMRFCPYAERSVLYLAKKNIPVEVVNVNLVNKPKWLLEKNPLGKVPTLEHDGKVVYESAVVNEYLDEIFPESSVLPKDPYERAHQKILVERLSSIPTALYGVVRSTPETRDAAVEAIKKALANADSLLTDDFYGGKSTGFADLSIWPFLERLGLFALRPELNLGEVPSKENKKLIAYIERMKQQPEVKAAMRPIDQHAAF
uniref:Glutathione S-transferase omega n=1 Tax=Plectus sambesii TaxID=2011161 RepID=A0A914UYU3_9BILA